MPPTLALLLGWGFIGFVLRHELRRSRDTVTGALWLPTIWVAIISSRPLSLWLSHVGLPLGPTSVEEGSPLDAAFYSILILLGVMALSNRRLDWAALVSSNKCLAVFLIFAASSLFWSDMPFVTFKRFLRTCGHLVMVLVVLTEPQPVEAFKALVRRIAYVLLPLALVFIKYFPHLASRYDQWTGAQIISGVSLTKNMFGQLCLITGLVLAWIVLGQLRRKSKIEDRRGFAIDAYMVFLAVHLIYRVNSKTSLACLLFGIGVLIACGSRTISERVGVVTFVGVGAFFLLDWSFGIVDAVTLALGRDPTWTNRSLIWAELSAMNSSWMLGEGFDSFWLGDRLQMIWETRHINEAHNGYLELILNLGIIGLVLFCGVILAAYVNCHRRVLEPYGRIAMAMLLVAVVYNVAEAGFRGLSIMAFAFYVVAIEVPPVETIAIPPRRGAQPSGKVSLSKA